MKKSRTANPATSRHSKIWLLAGLASVGLLAWLAQQISEFGLPTGRASRTRSADDLGQLQHWAEQQEQGLPGLVQALASKQEAIRSTAQRLLLNQLTAWEQLPPEDAAGKMHALAAALAKHVSDYDARGRAVAAELALRMLSWRIQTHASGCSRMVAACGDVLRATSARVKPPSSLLAKNHPQLPRSNESSEPHFHEDWVAKNGPDFGNPRDLPGGGLPLETGPKPAEKDPTPGRLNPSPHAEPLPSESDHFGQRSPSSQEDSAEDTWELARSENRSWKPLRQPEGIMTRTAAEVPDGGDDNGDTVLLMRDLHDADSHVVERAAAKLKQRGFGPTQLELAKQMTSSDPDARRQVAEILPRVPGIDAEIWLIWLSRDENPKVRLAAMTVMATTGDPAMLKRLAQMARDDSDPRIREQGERFTSERSRGR